MHMGGIAKRKAELELSAICIMRGTSLSWRDLSQVTKVRVTALVGNTYHARVHMSTSGKDACSNEVDIDARPSDAINLAVRFNAPVYVNKQVCHHPSTARSALQEHKCHATADACHAQFLPQF